jgi:hypothetical protein
MRRTLTVIASILAGCLIIGLLFSRVTVSQVAPPAPVQNGRYQVVATTATAAPGADAVLFVVMVDTATSRCWMKGSGGKWADLGSPADGK